METLSSFQQKRQTIPKQKRKKSETILRPPPNTACSGRLNHRTGSVLSPYQAPFLHLITSTQ